jgi:hypothetical protein
MSKRKIISFLTLEVERVQDSNLSVTLFGRAPSWAPAQSMIVRGEGGWGSQKAYQFEG